MAAEPARCAVDVDLAAEVDEVPLEVDVTPPYRQDLPNPAIAVAPGAAAVGHASEADDVVVFELDGGAPRVAFEQL